MSTYRDSADKFSEGLLLMRANDYEGAVDVFTEAITLNPAYANAYRYRAQAFEKLGRADDARADMEKLSSLSESTSQESEQIRNRRVQRRNEIEQSTPTPTQSNTLFVLFAILKWLALALGVILFIAMIAASESSMQDTTAAVTGCFGVLLAIFFHLEQYKS